MIIVQDYSSTILPNMMNSISGMRLVLTSPTPIITHLMVKNKDNTLLIHKIWKCYKTVLISRMSKIKNKQSSQHKFTNLATKKATKEVLEVESSSQFSFGVKPVNPQP